MAPSDSSPPAGASTLPVMLMMRGHGLEGYLDGSTPAPPRLLVAESGHIPVILSPSVPVVKTNDSAEECLQGSPLQDNTSNRNVSATDDSEDTSRSDANSFQPIAGSSCELPDPTMVQPPLVEDSSETINHADQQHDGSAVASHDMPSTSSSRQLGGTVVNAHPMQTRGNIYGNTQDNLENHQSHEHNITSIIVML
ncbi:hypothetical protein V6N11_077662 [Hibiscus sabdariffa]|uniref:Uncharacterized protein n=1 Tax=Hibiscus sabdariffa TaxID=183260 RepID=A0ABR2TDU5_9ROSI